MSYTLEPPDTQTETPLSDVLAKLERSGSKAVSPKGAIGKYQIMPATARQYGFDPAKLTDDAYAEKAANRIGADLVKQFGGDEDAILVAYNAGPKRAKEWIAGGRKFDDLPSETQGYLRRAHGLDRAPKPARQPASAPEQKGGYTLVPPTPVDKARAAAEAKAKEEAKQAEVKAKTAKAQDQYVAQASDPSGLGRFGMGVANRIWDAAKSEWKTLNTPPDPKAGFVERQQHIDTQTGGSQNLLATAAAAPEIEALKGTVGNLWHSLTGGSSETAANVAAIGLGGAAGLTALGGAAGRKVLGLAGRNTLKAMSGSEHAARVARLQDEGIYVTPWAEKGGNIKRLGDAKTSSPFVGNAFLEAQNKSVETFNRALYNRALRPIGEVVRPDAPVGRDGIAMVGSRLSRAYDQILPSVSVKSDPKGVADIRGLMSRAKTLGEAGEKQYNAIIHQELLRHFEGGKSMDGRQFKAAESELTRLSRSMKGSQDHNQRELGHLLDDTAEALREAAERSSPPGIRQRLKAINSGYAVFTRIQDASARRITAPHEGEFGVISPTDLMFAVKKGDRSVRKGAFARGDALLQDFAEDAAAVLPNKLPDSGTAMRLNANKGVVGTAVDAGVGGITNHLARTALNRLHASPRNYLKSAQGRLTARNYGGAGAISGAAALESDQQ